MSTMREPDMTGERGRKAWRSQVSHEGSARLETWIMEVPGAHVAWDKWLASVAHLRDIEGVEPAAKRYPQAEYELSVFALRDKPREGEKPLDIDGGVWPIMTPSELVFQFHGVSDMDAKAVLFKYVRTIVELGQASPDSDFRRYWQGALVDIVGQFHRGETAVQ